MGVSWVVEENGCQSLGGESYLVEGVLGQGGYAKVFDDDDDDDDDIYIMVKCLFVCMFVTKNHHFFLLVSCNHLNHP